MSASHTCFPSSYLPCLFVFCCFSISASLSSHSRHPSCFRLISLSFFFPDGWKFGISKWKPSCHLNKMKQGHLGGSKMHLCPWVSYLRTSVAIPTDSFPSIFLFAFSTFIYNFLHQGTGFLLSHAESSLILHSKENSKDFYIENEDQKKKAMQSWKGEMLQSALWVGIFYF